MDRKPADVINSNSGKKWRHTIESSSRFTRLFFPCLWLYYRPQKIAMFWSKRIKRNEEDSVLKKTFRLLQNQQRKGKTDTLVSHDNGFPSSLHIIHGLTSLDWMQHVWSVKKLIIFSWVLDNTGPVNGFSQAGSCFNMPFRLPSLASLRNKRFLARFV